ncbi:MAG: ABC transporter permease [Bacteroidetes bacterium]|nr:ABC transporter permease [Bacteroidota bacterium]MCL2302078.1 ABC transporter permease [Lentimicrobiaceae bacterium]
MRVILMLIKKEFLQVFRNTLLMQILIVAPLVQFLLFPFTADYEIKTLNIAFIDNDRSTITREMRNKFEHSKYFVSYGLLEAKKEAEDLMLNDHIDILIEFPQHFEKSIMTMESTTIAITANAINSVKAGIGVGYVQTVLGEFYEDKVTELSTTGNVSAKLLITNIYWYNEQMNYKNLIVPGILVILVTLIGAYVTALNIVREKEIGTIEQINVSPIQKWQFLVGKMIPFWILGMAEFLLGLFLMKIVFGISVQGSLPVLISVTSIYLLVMLGLGFFISSISSNQLQAMFIVFFLFIVFVLLSGLFTPIEGMPQWAKYINYLNPMSYYMDVIKLIVLKGSGIEEIKMQISVLSGMAVIINAAALFSYRETKK